MLYGPGLHRPLHAPAPTGPPAAADDQDRWTGALVELSQDGKLEFSTTVDDLGAFQAEGIMTGSKELQIISKDNSLKVVSNFEAPN